MIHIFYWLHDDKTDGKWPQSRGSWTEGGVKSSGCFGVLLLPALRV